MKYESVYIKRNLNKNPVSEFFMRFHNTTGGAVPVRTLNDLFIGTSGSPVLISAVVERSGNVKENVKGSGNTIKDFTVVKNESCVFRMTWRGGLFSLQGRGYNSYSAIVRSAGCKINSVEDVAIPNGFLKMTFVACVNYNQKAGDVFDMRLNVTSIGDGFLQSTWDGCTSLTAAVVPDTSNWNISGAMPQDFFGRTWYGCTSLVDGISVNTTNWSIQNTDAGFMGQTWRDCSRLVSAILPDTTNWPFAYGRSYFMHDTLAITTPLSSGITVTLKGGVYTGAKTPFPNVSLGLADSNTKNIKVDTELIRAYQNSSSWNNITDNKFISW